MSFLEELLKYKQSMEDQLKSLQGELERDDQRGLEYSKPLIQGQIIQLKSDLSRTSRLIQEYRYYVRSIKSVYQDFADIS